MKEPKTAIQPSRQTNFPDWYQEVIKAADLAEHSPVRGCMIIKPWGYAIWELIQSILDEKIKETGHENVYFPLLIPLSFLEKEAAHVEGFAKECAVVTHYRLEGDGKGKLIPSPEAQLAEPYIIRPTSETIIGNAMSRWVQSYQDLPILLNQWANVMRWEMRTRLFLRTSEFLWQEGHTAHANAEEAMEETLKMLDIYAQLATDYLAMPVIKGEKTPAERFPGAVNTYCIEAMMQDGKALQAGTSHFLGQNFSKAYNIQFSDKQQQSSFAWTTSWGVSTRLIGGLIMSHSDDDGLVLPPKVAPKQIVIIPYIMSDQDKSEILAYCESLAKELQAQFFANKPIRVLIDKSEKRAGEKFWAAVKKGIPLRVEIGRREMQANTLTLTRRDKPAKEKQVITREGLINQAPRLLGEIQDNVYEKAQAFRKENTQEVDSLGILENLFSQDENVKSGFASAYFDPAMEQDPQVAEKLKALKLTIRCIPFAEQESPGQCIFSGKTTSKKVILARAY